MSREWKPGDVAMIEVGCHANRHRATYVSDDGWRYGNDQWVANDPAIVTALRPLVVIDPEDREQVEQLCKAFLAEFPTFHKPSDTDALQAALREFADPTPPKPDEPQGLGAVVRGADGDLWVRSHRDPPQWTRLHLSGAYQYAEIDAVEVLSEGVAP